MNFVDLKIILWTVLLSLLINNALGLSAEGILGGALADEGMFKHHVQIMVDYQHLCGGALVAPNFVLTAAHCVCDHASGAIKPEPYRIVAGTENPNVHRGREAAVAKVYVHRDFAIQTDCSAKHDIALLRLKKGFKLAKYPRISTLELPRSGDLYAGAMGLVSGSGWIKLELTTDPSGKEYEYGWTDGQLRYGFVRVLSDEECRRTTFGIHETNVCGQMMPWSHVRMLEVVVPANAPKRLGVCTGDSGSALVYGNTTIGIFSNGPHDCDESHHPATYTRVSLYIGFIDDVMADKTSDIIRSLEITDRRYIG